MRAKRSIRTQKSSRPTLQIDEKLQGKTPKGRDTATKRWNSHVKAAPGPSPLPLQPDKPAEERRRRIAGNSVKEKGDKGKRQGAGETVRSMPC
jgi:hypothetical protein